MVAINDWVRSGSPYSNTITTRLFRVVRRILAATMFMMLVLLSAVGRLNADDRATAVLQNSGFESPNPSEGWELSVYGAQPQIDADRTIFHAGRQSLHVRALDPTDTAFGQEIAVTPGQTYRLTGWVRTRDIRPLDARVSGTFQVQSFAGRSILATGRNHSGTVPWSREQILFRAPSDGRVRIVAFFAGFGKGVGEAWFDDLSLTEVNVSMQPIKVTREPLCSGEISPLQYGQFIEYLCDLVPSMWAEKLYDGGFEGLTPYRFRFIAETDFKEKPWYPSGAVNRTRYTLDRDLKVAGQTSQRVEIEEGAPCTAGVSQDGVSVRKSEPCVFTIWTLHSEGPATAEVVLHAGDKQLASAPLQLESSWTKSRVELSSAADSDNATLSIRLTGRGVTWFDNASLMPKRTIGGWRTDVVDAVKVLKPGIIRFGGSALDDGNLGDFEWRDTVGDVDHRKTLRAWGGLQPSAAGLEEIVQFCHAVGAEPLICVRVRNRVAHDAADEVEYFNGGVDTPMGAMRAQNGHAEPYRIRYWQVGNEQAGGEYESHLAEFCRAMRAVDPSIKILSSYPSPSVLKDVAASVDYTCPHQYDCADLAGTASQLDETREMIRDYAGGRNVRVGVTEWNTTGGDWGLKRAGLWNLSNALACSRYHNLLHRYCDLVEIANRSNLVNSFCSGIVQTNRSGLYKTPTYYAQELYSTLAGRRALKIDSEVPADFSPDVSATLSQDGNAVVLFAVNDSTVKIERTVDLSAFGEGARDIVVHTLADKQVAGSPDVTNSFEEPERVAPVERRLHTASAKFAMTFPPLSLTVLVVPTHGR